MDKMIWDETYSVNVSEIDLQHQILMEMSNELNDAIKEKKDNHVLGKIISGLISYTETHFKTEEKYFEQLSYPDTIEHIKEHSLFIQKVSEIIDAMDTEKQTLSSDVVKYLNKWLKIHIKGTDKKYSTFFNEKGLF
ncbi:MAG: hemerythrin family protein [Desulfobacteraceae bacterium]|nr:hemerythrin family protein [Desulfobacteraceae bacterium]